MTLSSSTPLNPTSSGIYIPPHKRRRIQNDNNSTSNDHHDDILQNNTNNTNDDAVIQQQQQQQQGSMNASSSTKEAQYQSFHLLSQSLQSLINKTNHRNLPTLIPHYFNINLIRCRGVFCKLLLRAQQGHGDLFTEVYAALVAVINTKMPEIGELLIHRLLLQFQQAYGTTPPNPTLCRCTLKFLAHLVNQQVAHVVLAGQICGLLLEQPTNDSVELCVYLMKECGKMMQELAPKISHAVFETLRGILLEGKIDKRVQYMIESLFTVRQRGYQKYPGVPKELDLVESRDQITHEVELDDELDAQEELDRFQYDEDFDEHEERYEEIKREILGDDYEELLKEGADGEAEEQNDQLPAGMSSLAQSSAADGTEKTQQQQLDLTDVSNVEVRRFKRDVYLMFASSMDHEECAFKILKSGIAKNREMELCSMIISSCTEATTYNKFYGLLAERFCFLDRIYQEKFEDCFRIQYSMVDNLELAKLRSVARLFAHLLETDALSWTVMQNVRITADSTSMASRIFIKILFHELQERMGLQKLKDRLRNEYLVSYFEGLFPMDDPKNTKFAIHFWNSIGLSELTEELQLYLDNAPKELLEDSDDEDDSSSEGSDDSDSSSSDDLTSSDDETEQPARNEEMFS